MLLLLIPYILSNKHLTRKCLEEGVLHTRLAPEIWTISHIVEKWGARPTKLGCSSNLFSPDKKSLFPWVLVLSLWFHWYCPRRGTWCLSGRWGRERLGIFRGPNQSSLGPSTLILGPFSLLFCSFPQTLHSFKCYWISIMYQACAMPWRYSEELREKQPLTNFIAQSTRTTNYTFKPWK